MSTLLDRLKKAGSTAYSEVLSESSFFNKKDSVPTRIPIINLALSGKLGGGLTSGLTFIAGPSKHFKSLLGLLMVRAYMEKYPEAYCIYYDSEFGVTPEYIKANGIDPSRVLHVPIEHIEQLKFDISKKLEEIKKGDKVIIFVDSVGNLASKKEADDALDGKSVADMSRAKQLKSLFRIVTPKFTTCDIPCIVINHTYQEIGMFPKTIMGGGTGPMYSANQVFIIGKSQEKEGGDLVGWNFTINIEKSRFVREKAKFPFTVTYKGGISKWSGLLDLALESGHVTKPSNGWYQRVDMETGEVIEPKVRASATNSKDFWMPILTCKKFNSFLEEKFMVSNTNLVQEEEIEESDDD